MSATANRVLITQDGVKLSRDSWGAPGIFWLALRGPETVIALLQDQEDADAELSDDIWCEGSLLVNEVEKFVAVGMLPAHFFSFEKGDVTAQQGDLRSGNG